MAYKLIYNPLIDYIRSHVCLCVVMLCSKASSLCTYSGMVYCGMQAKCMCTYGGIKIGLLYNNTGYVM